MVGVQEVRCCFVKRHCVQHPSSCCSNVFCCSANLCEGNEGLCRYGWSVLFPGHAGHSQDVLDRTGRRGVPMDLAVRVRKEGRRTRAVTAYLVFRIAIEDIEEV